MDNSSENLVGRPKPGFVDVDQIKFQRQEMKRARAEQLDHLYNQNYQPAKYSVALDYKNTRSYKKKIGQKGYKEILLFDDPAQFKHFGLGPYFFIEYIRRITWLFFFFSILSVYMIYLNYMGSGMNAYKPSFSTPLIETTLGNYSGFVVSSYDSYIMAIIPGVIIFAFFVFYFCWKSHYFGEIDVEEEDHTIVKPEKFCLEISGLDRKYVDQRALERVFSTFGPVYEVSLVRRFKNNLVYFQKLDQIQEEMKEQQLEIILGSGDKESLQQLKKEKDSLNKYINTLRITPQITSAFIHFQYEKSKVDCLTYFNEHYLFDTDSHACMHSMCCCCVDQISEQYHLNGRPLKILNSKVSKPQDINWDAYDIDGCTKCLRISIACIIILLFVIVSCTVIAMCSIYINTSSIDCEDFNNKDCLKDTCSDNDINCFCTNNLFTINNDKIQKYCEDKVSQIILSKTLQFAVTGISAVTNILFGFVCGKLVDFTRPKTNSAALATKTIIYTCFLIFNTIFIPILIYSDIYGFRATNYASLLTIISADLKNALQVDKLNFYIDFQKIWYNNVSQIFLNFVMFDMAATWLFFIYTKCVSGDTSSLKDNQGSILQKTMNEKITSFKFNIYIEYSYFNLITFMAIFLAAGVPAIIPLAWLNLLSKYITFRSVIQSESTKIQGLGEDFMSLPLTFIPVMIIISAPFGAWMLTANQNLIPPMLDLPISIKLPEGFQFYQLVRQLYLPYFLIIALLMLAWYMFENTILRFCSWLSSLCFDRKATVHPYHTFPFSQYAKSMNVITSYNIRNNDKMRNAILNLEKYIVANEDKF